MAAFPNSIRKLQNVSNFPIPCNQQQQHGSANMEIITVAPRKNSVGLHNLGSRHHHHHHHHPHHHHHHHHHHHLSKDAVIRSFVINVNKATNCLTMYYFPLVHKNNKVRRMDDQNISSARRKNSPTFFYKTSHILNKLNFKYKLYACS